jgi:hypothetical protein
MSLKIGRTLTLILATAVLAGFVHFVNTRSVFASSVQSTVNSTTTDAIAAPNRITFSMAQSEVAVFGDSALVAGDFNRDGHVDLAIANDNFQGVAVRLGLPDFQNDASYPTGAGANEVLTADFNHDGNLDLAVANAGTNTVSILLGNGDGTFHKINDVSLAGNPKAIAAADFNRDGFADLAVMDCISHSACHLSTFRGHAIGDLTLAQRISLPGPPNLAKGLMVTIDFNRDGRPDVALVSGNTQAMIFIDSPTGQLQLHSSFKLPNASIASSMAWGSFNHDVLPDLVFRVFDVCGKSCSFANSAYIFLNTGAGSFVLRDRIGVSASPAGGLIAVTDVNGDNTQDILTINEDVNNAVMQYSLNHGDGKFDPAVTVFTLPAIPDTFAPLQPAGMFVRDMNFDSRHDFGEASEDPLGDDLGGWFVFNNDNAQTNCAPPNSAKLAARICSPLANATVGSSLTIKGSGNSPAGVKRMELWIDGSKRFEEWNDQLLATISLTRGRHRIVVQAVDQDDSFSPARIFVTVP